MTNKKDLSERDICTKFIRPGLEQAGWNEVEPARYSLIISIRAPEVDADIYSVVAAKVAPVNAIQV